MSTASADDTTSGLSDGSLLGGRYRLGELLGVGSSAAVFAAVDVTAEDGPPLAVKVLHAHLCQERAALMAFHREGKASATVRHPRVVRVEDLGNHDAGGISVGWLALERVDGDNLVDAVRARGRLAPTEAVEVMYGVLEGLTAIHEAGLVHRDLTPRNVLVSADGDRPITRDRVHIADLGLADVTGRTARVADREVVGTPAYISPEQVTGEPVDARADLYQAGALLYFLLVGQPPYPRDTTEQIVDAHLYAPPPVPSVHVRDAAPLDRLVTRALSKQQASRFQSAAEFRDALESALPDAVASAIAAPAIDATAVLAAATTPASYLPVVPVAPEPYRRARSDSRAGIVAALLIGLLVLVPVLQTVLPGAASATGTVAPSPSAASTANGVVPRLTGTLQDAQAALVAQGFVIEQVTQRNSSEVEGRVLEQHPEPGSLAPRGSAVAVVIASGRNAVPQVAGLTVTAAAAQLKAAGFVVAGQTRAGSLVGGSTPMGGQVVRVGSTVTLVATTTTPTPTPSPNEPTDSASVSTPPATPSATPTTASSTASATRTATPSASGGA